MAFAQTTIGVGIILGAYIGGQITHRARPRHAILSGILVCLLSAILGFSAGNERNELGFGVALALYGFGQAIAWPAIETALLEAQKPSRIQGLVGYFNLTWSLVSATAFFIASPLMHFFGLSSLFSVPVIIYAVTLLYLLFALPLTPNPAFVTEHSASNPNADVQISPLSERSRRLFRWLGWLANPLSFIAINVVVVYNPAIQTRLHLDFASATIWLSLWFYFRTVGFEIFRRWEGWHYNWILLCVVYVLTLFSFSGIVFAPNLASLLISQAVFGVSLGLIYQSSLFYSMAGSEAQGEHGGLHECFVGVGLTVGTLIAFLGNRFYPAQPALPLFAVIAVMMIGLCAMIGIGLRTRAT